MLLAVICLVNRMKLQPQPEDILAFQNSGIMVGKGHRCGIEGFEKNNSLAVNLHGTECGFGDTGKCASNQKNTAGFNGMKGDNGGNASDKAQRIWAKRQKEYQSKSNFEAQNRKLPKAQNKDQASMSLTVNLEVHNSHLPLCNISHLPNNIKCSQTKDQQTKPPSQSLESDYPTKKDHCEDQNSKQSPNQQTHSPNITRISAPNNDPDSPQTDIQINPLQSNSKPRINNSSDSDQHSTLSTNAESSSRQQSTPESSVQTNSSPSSDQSSFHNFQSRQFCYPSPKVLCFDFEEDLWYHQRKGLIRKAKQERKYFNVRIVGFPFGRNYDSTKGSATCFGARLVVFDFYRLSLNGFSLLLKGEFLSFKVYSVITTN